MQVPPQISFDGYEKSPVIENAIREQIDKLERHCPEIVSVSVKVAQRSAPPAPPAVRLEVRLPALPPIVVTPEPGRLQRKYQRPDVTNALHEAFDVALRRATERHKERTGRPEATKT